MRMSVFSASSVGARRTALAVVAVAAAGGLAATSFASDASTARPRDARPGSATTDTGQVSFVQAVPQTDLSITVDGKAVKAGVAEGSVVGPLSLPAGTHQVAFTSGATTITSSVDVTTGKMADVVVHRPASVGGTPIVSVYPAPTKVLGPGKARVLIAHTATTPPVDVQVDGKTVFTNIANGEYAEADLPAGTHKVTLAPLGVMTKPVLGPVSVDLRAGTLTAVYAVGNPQDESMNVITRITQVGTDTSAPSAIDTGSAGLVSDVLVHPFGHR